MKNNNSIYIYIYNEPNQYQTDVAKFLIELRKTLKMTIEQFISALGWIDGKYYDQIIHGVKDKDGNRKLKQPTIRYLFTAINYAVNNNEIFCKNKHEIKKLINKYIIKF